MERVWNMKSSQIFPCYSIPLRNYLTSLGIKYEIVGLHPKSNAMFWAYIKSEELKEAMLKWSEK